VRAVIADDVENARKVVLLALTKGWWFRPLYDGLRYGEKVLCFQFIEENKQLSDAAFEAAVERMHFSRARPISLPAMVTLLTAANYIAQQLPKKPTPSASIHVLKIK
jgi:hypothetical protein